MIYQTESKPQCWRAVAVFDDRPEQLIFLGRSSTHVRANFGASYFDLLDDEEREHVQSIALQQWNGAPDAGRWQHKSNLNVPTSITKLTASA